MEDLQTSTDVEKTKPAQADGNQQVETNGQDKSENKTPDEQQETKPSDYASKSDTQEEIDYRKKFQESSREVQKLLEYKKKMETLDELSKKDPRIIKWIDEAKEGKIPQSVETEEKTLDRSLYDDFIENVMKDSWTKATKEVEEEFSDVISDKSIKDRMLSYTKQRIIDRNGILVNPLSGKPYSPDEYRNVLREAAIIASSDKLYSKAKNEGEMNAFAKTKMNDMATSSTIGSSNTGKGRLDAPVDVINAFKAVGVTDKEMPKYIERWKKNKK